MGLLDFDNADARLGLGLLAAASARPDGAGFGQRLMEGVNSVDQWKRQQQMAALHQMQIQQSTLQMQEAQRRIDEHQKLQAAAEKYSNPTGFDYRGYANEIARFSPEKALSVSQLLQKETPVNKLDPKDFTPQSVSMFVKSGNYSDLVPITKDPAGTELHKLIAERDTFPVGSPNRKLYEQQIQKLTTHQPQVQVSYGAPVAGVDESGKQVFFQPSKDGSTPAIIPGVAPTPKPIPESVQQSIRENNVVLGKINKAIEGVDKYPSAFGMQNLVGDSAMQRFDPAGVEIRAIVADIGGQKIHDRSGAAVSVGESERLKPYIPAATDKPETVAKKLKLFQAEYSAMQKELQGGASVADATKGKSPIATKRWNPATGKLENVSN